MSNFAFLSSSWPVLAGLGDLAEKNLYLDPNTSLIKLRMFGEVMAKYLLAYEKLNEPADGTQITRLNVLSNTGIIPDLLLPQFHSLRKVGNRATHEAFGSLESARTQLHFAYRLAAWFRETYGAGDFAQAEFAVPEQADSESRAIASLNQELAERSVQLEERCSTLQAALENLKAQEVSSEQKTKRRKVSARSAANLQLSEAETRQLIDEQLNAAGWLTGTLNLRYAKGARPEKGVNKAIAEWPTSSGPADYAMFVHATGGGGGGQEKG